VLAAMAVAASLATCVPMRWIDTAADSLALLKGSPVNCLLLEESQWPLIDAIHKLNLRSIAVAHDTPQAERAARTAATAIAAEGDFALSSSKPLIRLTTRRALHFDTTSDVIGTTQGVWPGIEIEHAGPKSTTAAPTGSAWINTNTGFLRYARSATPAVFWLANRPAPQVELTASRYLRAIADAAAVGVRWVIALDEKFASRLIGGDATARAGWTSIGTMLRFYEENHHWVSWKPWAQLAIVQDPASGALVTGNLLDMLSVMNTPVRAVPTRELNAAKLEATQVTVTVKPQAYTPEQIALIRQFAKKGGTVVRGPEAWTMPLPEGDQITFNKQQYKALEAIWPELHVAVQRKNFGVRMFNVSGTLTYLQKSPDSKQVVLQLVNFTDFTVENITAFVQGKYKKAVLHAPGESPRPLSIYDAPEGTGVEIDKLGVSGAVVLE
jgi:hypothetical protein